MDISSRTRESRTGGRWNFSSPAEGSLRGLLLDLSMSSSSVSPAAPVLVAAVDGPGHRTGRPLPLTVLSGFPSSGKTTLLRWMLRQAGRERGLGGNRQRPERTGRGRRIDRLGARRTHPRWHVGPDFTWVGGYGRPARDAGRRAGCDGSQPGRAAPRHRDERRVASLAFGETLAARADLRTNASAPASYDLEAEGCACRP